MNEIPYSELPKRVKKALREAFPRGVQRVISLIVYDQNEGNVWIEFDNRFVETLDKYQMRALCRADGVAEISNSCFTFSFPCFTRNGRRYDV